MIERVVGVVVAVIAAIFSLPAPVAAAPAPGAAIVYAYNGHHGSAQLDNAASERGPPAAHDHTATAYDGVDRWSRGTLARPDGLTASSSTTYAYPAILGPVAQATTTTARHAVAAGGELSLLRRSAGAAKSVDEAGALVPYDAMAASRNLLGQVGEGYARTPSGYTVSAHAAERIVYGAPGRSPTTLSRVDDILNNPTRTMMRDNGTIRVYQGKDWVAVRDTGPIHIVTVMVR
ncbi:hypothetical protein GCM10028801_45700 [Nocardioides maradonensis]